MFLISEGRDLANTFSISNSQNLIHIHSIMSFNVKDEV